MSKVLRLCLDLNVWCCAVLADQKGRQRTGCQNLVEFVQDGKFYGLPIRLIVSWGMLNHLDNILQKPPFLMTFDESKCYIKGIVGYAIIGPTLTLGGTGLVPIQDEEDRHVLETAIAGRANILATFNYRDFLTSKNPEIIPNQYSIYETPDHRLKIIHPFLLLDWLRQDSPLLNAEYF